VYFVSEKMISFSLFKQLLKDVDPDYAYVNGVYSLKFSILPLVVLRCISYKGRVLQGTYGMLADTAINIKRGKKMLFLSIAKFFNLYKKVVFHSTSKGETTDIRRIFGQNVPVLMAPHFPEKNFPQLRFIEKQLGILRLISVARISPEKNTMYALECLHQLKQFEGTIVFDLYGPIYDELYWIKCLKIIEKLPENIMVNYIGLLEGKEVMNKMMEYHFLFMPTYGENFGYAILESFMCGRPVLISDRTPWVNLSDKMAGYDLSLDRPDLFVKLIHQLIILDQKDFELLCKGAQQVAVDFVNNPKLLELNLKLFD